MLPIATRVNQRRTISEARESTEFACIEIDMWVFSYFSPEPPMRFGGEKWTGGTARRDYRETKNSNRDYVSRFRTWYRNRGQYRHAARIDFDKRARRIAEYYMRVCAYVFTRNAHRVVHASNAHAAYGVTGQFSSYKMFYFFFPLSNTYVKHLAKDTWSICARQLLSH